MTQPVCSSDQRTIRIIRRKPAITRRGVLLPHFERVFSWTCEMQRLDWKIVSAITIDAIHEGWTYTITQQPGKWLLCVEPIPARGVDWRKWFEARYLQDAMALATAIAAGIEIE